MGIKQTSLEHGNIKSSEVSSAERKDKNEKMLASQTTLANNTVEVKAPPPLEIQNETPKGEVKNLGKVDENKIHKPVGSNFNIPPPPPVEVQCKVCRTPFGHQSTLDRHMKLHRKR